MRRTGRRGRGGVERPPVDLALCRNPLDFLAEEHYRERSLCSLFDEVAETARPDSAALTRLLVFLEMELPAHVHAEIAHFFPMLRARCPAEDEIGPVIDAVVAEHDATMGGLPELAHTLRAHLADGSACTDAERVLLHDFAAHVRRHVVIENAILMPIARGRLSKADLSSLWTSMLEDRRTPVAARRHAC